MYLSKLLAGQSRLCFLCVAVAVCVMSFEEIISAVQSKPEIWLSSHPLYKIMRVATEIWNKLSFQLGIEGSYNFISIEF